LCHAARPWQQLDFDLPAVPFGDAAQQVHAGTGNVVAFAAIVAFGVDKRRHFGLIGAGAHQFRMCR
jgi:hypothetical protein